MNRREFLFSSAAFAAAGCVTGDRIGSTLPAWHEGELDIHFIHTGTGEQTFFVFPDGTTLLLDCGHVAQRKSGYAAAVPAQPSDRLRGGEWVSRYLQRRIRQRELDYVMVSHWHDDHVQGLADVAKDFAFRRWTDHQFPHVGIYFQDADETALAFGREFIPAARAKGMKAAPFTVGALNQLAMVHGGASDKSFRIRNLSSNGVVWDGKDGMIDCAAAHLATVPAAKRRGIHENMLSNAFRLDYGAFSYYTGGDTEMTFRGADGREFDWEAKVGAASGPVDVCKTNHHAYWNAMHEGFVREIRARVYLSSVWSPNQVNDRNLPIIASQKLYPGERTVYHGFLPIGSDREFKGRDFTSVFSPAQGHQVIRVAPGGGSYEVFTVSATDESDTIIGHRRYESRGTRV